MTEMQQCPDCGATIEPGAVDGHCASCLLRIGLAVVGGDDELGDGEPVSHGNRPTRLRYLGDYELIEEIGRGGMGVVYRARQVSLNRTVALKLVRSGELASENEVARFRAEAEAAAGLDHPHIVPIHEIGQHEDQQYFSMKLFDGGSLSERIANFKLRSSTRDTANLLATIARAVHYAHQRGILHRDLKPGNILIDAQGQPHVTDFGLARRIGADSSMTLSGAILGSPSYISPEQATGAKQLSTAADVYSLGAILYELLAGHPPFVGATVMETLQKVMNEEPERITISEPRFPAAGKDGRASRKSQTVNPDLETICLKCLEKDAARRYSSAEALAEDLERWLRDEPIHARPVPPQQRLWLWCRRKPAIAGLAAAGLLSVLLGIAGITWQWRKAVTARANAQENAAIAERELRRSELVQLQLVVGSRRQGHRLESLRLIQKLAHDAHGDELRDLAITALGSSDARQVEAWHSLPLEPSCPPAFDGQLARVALGDSSGGIKLLSFPGLQEIKQLSVTGGTAGSIEWVNKDQWLAVVLLDGRVMLFDVASARVVFEAKDCSGPGRGHRIAVHPSGSHLAMSGVRNRLRVFDLKTRIELPAVTLAARVESLAFNSTGARLAVSFMDHLQVREFPSLALLTDDPHEQYFANQMAWELHDRWVFGAMQGWNILRLHPGLGREGQIFASAHDSAAQSLSRNDAGSLLVSSGADNTSRLWDARIPGSVLTLPRLTALRFAGEGNRFAVWHKSQGLAIFEAVRPVEVRHLVGNPPHTLQLLTCVPHPALPLAAAASKYHAAVFDLETGEARVDVELPGSAGAFVDGDGNRLLTVSQEGLQAWPILRTNDSPYDRWGLDQPRLIAVLGTNFLPTVTSGAPGTGVFFAAGSDRTVVVGLGDGRILREMPPPERPAFPAISHDGSWWVYSQATPESTWLTLSNAPSARRLLTNMGGRVVMNRDGSLLAVAGSSRIECFDTRSWQSIWSAPVELASDASSQCSFSADGKWLGASLNSHDAVLLNSATGRVLVRFKPPASPLVLGVSFSRGDTQLFVNTIRGLFVWDLVLVRRELARLGLDWRDENPGESFAPRR